MVSIEQSSALQSRIFRSKYCGLETIESQGQSQLHIYRFLASHRLFRFGAHIGGWSDAPRSAESAIGHDIIAIGHRFEWSSIWHQL